MERQTEKNAYCSCSALFRDISVLGYGCSVFLPVFSCFNLELRVLFGLMARVLWKSPCSAICVCHSQGHCPHITCPLLSYLLLYILSSALKLVFSSQTSFCSTCCINNQKTQFSPGPDIYQALFSCSK